MRKTDKSTPLDDCEPCYGSGRACRMNPSGGSYCGCMAPLEQDANGQCDCAWETVYINENILCLLYSNQSHFQSSFSPGYVYFPNNPLREVCVDVCELDFCSAGERCIHAEGGVICDNGENSDAISAILSAFVLGISLLLLWTIQIKDRRKRFYWNYQMIEFLKIQGKLYERRCIFCTRLERDKAASRFCDLVFLEQTDWRFNFMNVGKCADIWTEED